MKITTFEISSHKKLEVINISNKVEAWLRQINAASGLLHISLPHATAALIANEDESGLKKDLVNVVKNIELLNQQIGGFAHNRIDNNAAAHLASMVFGSSLTFAVISGKISRGTWQEILFLELDGPREIRKINLSFIESK